jgi:hypothetical protein
MYLKGCGTEERYMADTICSTLHPNHNILLNLMGRGHYAEDQQQEVCNSD